MKKILILILIIFSNNLIIYSTYIVPKINLNSIDINSCKILKEIDSENLSNTANWRQFNDYYKNRNRKVYLTSDNKFVIKIWQKNYASTSNFLAALDSKFYDKIALIEGIIFDDENECRGYMSPVLIDRKFNRDAWDAYGLMLEKGDIGVKIFSNNQNQPQIYKDLFASIISNSKRTKFITLDFCPDNIAFDKNGKAYLIDLEDVLPIDSLNNDLIQKIFFCYNPKDYLQALKL